MVSEKISIDRLLEILCRKKFSEQEKERISKCIADENSLASRVLDQELQKSPVFRDYAKRQRVAGYRAGGKHHTARALDRLVNAWRQNKANHPQWEVYISICQSYLDQNKGEFSDLIHEEIEVSKDLIKKSEKVISQELMTGICALANDHHLYSHNIKEFYELYPIARLENIDDLVSQIADYEKLDKLEDEIRGQRDEIQIFQLKAAEARLRHSEDIKELHEQLEFQQTNINTLSGYRNDYLDLKEEYSIQTKKLETQQTQVEKQDSQIRILNDELERLRTLFRKQELSIDKIVLEEEKIRKQLDNVSENSETWVDLLQEEMEKQNASIEAKYSGEREASDKVPRKYSNLIQSRSSESESADSPATYSELDEGQFINLFVKQCASDYLEYSRNTVELFHRLVLAGTVICLDDSDLLNSWVTALGWQRYHYQTCASPTWSDPEAWQEEQMNLFDGTKEPSIVSILDFDKGLVPAYLEPILKQWSQVEIEDSTKKLFLVRSKPSVKEDFNALTTPLMHLEVLNMTLRASPDPKNSEKSLKSKKNSNGVLAPSCVEAWSPRKFTVPTSAKNPLLQALMMQNIFVPNSLKRQIGRMATGLKGTKYESEIQDYSSDLTVRPWLEVNHPDLIDSYEELVTSKSK